MKELLKRILKKSPIPLTKNHRYDLQTQKIMRRFLREDSNCVDVGCYKGEILDIMLGHAPRGHHFGFEPIPKMYADLEAKYAGQANVTLHNVALSDEVGSTTFNYVVSNPSYSGIKKRDYDRPNEEDTQIEVRTARLDEILPAGLAIDLIKIDVEGAELQVLRGARQTLTRSKPIVVFEHGLGASDAYGTTPEEVFAEFEAAGMGVFTLDALLADKPPLDRDGFHRQYHDRLNYYFVAKG